MRRRKGRAKRSPATGLGRSTAFTFALKCAGLGIAFASQLLLARMLGTSGYGDYAYVMAWLGLLLIPALFGLDKLLVREVAALRARGECNRLIATVRRALGFAGSLSVGTGALLLAAAWLLPGRRDLALVFAAGVAVLPVGALAAILSGALLGLGRVVSAQIPQSLVRPGAFVLLLLCLHFVAGAEIGARGAAALFVAASGLSLAALALLYRRHRPAPAGAAAVPRDWRWLRAALPFLVVSGMHVVNARTDTVMIGAMRGTADAGIYAMASRVADLALLVLMAVNTPLAPAVARMSATGDRAGLERLALRASRTILVATIPIAILLIAAGRPLLEFLGPGFGRGSTVLVVLVAAQLVNAAAGSVGLLLEMTGHVRDTAMGVGAAAVANVGLNAILIPRFGIEGAAAATATSILLWNVLLTLRVRDRLGIRASALATLWSSR